MTECSDNTKGNLQPYFRDDTCNRLTLTLACLHLARRSSHRTPRGKEMTMKKQELVALLKSVSVEDLKNAIPMKEKIERLEKRRKSLEKELASVTQQMESLGMPEAAKPPARAKRKRARKAKRRRIAQPSLSSLVVEILKEKKKPLKINDICDALLKEKNYKTRAKDFKAQIRVMMYRNDRGLFKKAGPGLFNLAADTKPTKKATKRTRRKVTKKVTKMRKKKTTKRKKGKKKTTKKKTKK